MGGPITISFCCRTFYSFRSALRLAQEIVAEFVAATLAALDGRTAHLGTSYEYLAAYAERMRMPTERAVFSLLREIEEVLLMIL